MIVIRPASVRRALCVAAAGVVQVHVAFAAGFNIPTDAPPSPLTFNGQTARPFTQPMFIFEEFGTKPLPPPGGSGATLPVPTTCAGGPAGAALDDLLAQPIWPDPTVDANTQLHNPWAQKIGACIGKTLQTSAIEGRPTGLWFAHQRYDEFAPAVYFQTAQAGARDNGGLRDTMQRHQFKYGEFGPTGLYYNGGTNKSVQVRFHPALPVQSQNSVWTFDGTMPPKLLVARYGEPIIFRHYNALPIDFAANNGFGAHTITTHEHNGHNPAESDGYTAAFFFPGQYYDYHWPMILAGRDSINTDAQDRRAGRPDGDGGDVLIAGDWRETMSTHWFHDHMLDFTAQNVYKGNAAMMNYYSLIDRGREGFKCHSKDPANNVNLCLPSGTSLDWGNRDYDVNVLVADKAWDANGQLFFNVFNKDGFLGDRVLVNWAYKPYFNVRARRYRFRILNGAVSRYFKIAIVTASGQRVPFHMIANDGNIMEHAIRFPNAQSQDLPTQGIAERYDVVIDFKNYVGQKLYMVNLMEHSDGKGPSKAIPLGDVLSGKYVGDPAVGKFLEFRVVAMPTGASDLSMSPADYEPGKLKMVPQPTFTAAELASARHRTFEFGRSNGTDGKPWTIKTDGGQGFTMDPHRISAEPEKGAVEIWHIKNGGAGWSHPVHVHFEEGKILARGGAAPPLWETGARKDVFRIGGLADSTNVVDIAIRIREFMGSYVEHCHNTQHEDHAMLLRWDSKNPGSTIAIPTPVQTWEGSNYEPSFSLTGSQTTGGSQ